MDLWNDNREHRKIVHIDLSEQQQQCGWASCTAGHVGHLGAGHRIVRQLVERRAEPGWGLEAAGSRLLCLRSGRWVRYGQLARTAMLHDRCLVCAASKHRAPATIGLYHACFRGHAAAAVLDNAYVPTVEVVSGQDFAVHEMTQQAHAGGLHAQPAL